MKKIIFICCFFTIFFVNAQDKKSYQLFDKNGNKTSYKKLLKKAKKSDIVFFGEYHNNAISHWLEYELLKDLAENNQVTMGLEMLERDNQNIVNQYINNEINQKQLDSLARLWSNYKDYAPMVDFAKEKKIKVIASNVPRKYASLVYKKGLQSLDTLSVTEKKWIAPLPIAYDGSLSQYQKMQKMAHSENDNFPKSQAIKDATMAFSILENFEKGTIFYHLNGGFHTDFFQGIVWYISQKKPDLKQLTITTVVQKDIRRLEKEYYQQADFILVVDEDMPTTF
ncbi:MAG: ChaN family lipoprotein [Capnocytophaga sp.]|nr:ChaN family lipoprotein [Capnocytophaga sp.]